MRKTYMSVGISTLEGMIGDRNELTFADMRNICIDANIGMDKRTVDNWISVLVHRGTLVPKRCGRSGTVIYRVNGHSVESQGNPVPVDSVIREEINRIMPRKKKA